MKKKIFIAVSDIASFIGQNKYSFHLNFERLWKRYDTVDYTRLIHHYQSQQSLLNSQMDNSMQEAIDITLALDNGAISILEYTQLLSALQVQDTHYKEKLTSTTTSIESIVLTEREKIGKALGESVLKQLESTESHINKKIVTQSIKVN